MTRFTHLRHAVLLASLLAVGLSVATSAAATQISPATSTIAVCEVVDVMEAAQTKSTESAPAKTMVASCGRASRFLGAAQSFETSYHTSSNGLVVVLRNPGSTRVLLVTLASEGFVRVEDFSRELARASGRFADEGLGDKMAIDLSAFSSDGRISVPLDSRAKVKTIKEAEAARMPPFAARDEATSKATLDMARYVAARDRSRR